MTTLTYDFHAEDEIIGIYIKLEKKKAPKMNTVCAYLYSVHHEVIILYHVKQLTVRLPMQTKHFGYIKDWQFDW